jgi:uncharacterized protein YegJ (DUF2314 family)
VVPALVGKTREAPHARFRLKIAARHLVEVRLAAKIRPPLECAAMKSIALIAPLVLGAALLGCSSKPETLVTEGYGQQEMDAAIARARAEVDHFITALEENRGEDHAVKAPVIDAGQTEHFWITDVTYKDGVFTGMIGNDPGTVSNVKFGDQWSVKRDEISDWMYMQEEKIHGGYTIDPLLGTMPAEEAEAMRQRLAR